MRSIAQKIKSRVTSRMDTYSIGRFSPCHRIESESEVFLTFDDGPDPRYTPLIADLLLSRGHRATFFCLGINAVKYPKIVRSLVESGHSVGSHSSMHCQQWETGTVKQLKDYETGHHQLCSVTGNKIKIFRPPYGYHDRRSVAFCRKYNQNLILWDVESLDWEVTATTDSVAGLVNAQVKPGSIVLMHDAIYDNPAAKDRTHTVRALKSILDFLELQGLRSAGIPC